MTHSDQLDQIGAAMALAQAEIEKAAKDRDNSFYKSTYATLGSVWDACKPALTAYGLSVLQFSELDDLGAASLTTMLLHSSGQYISGTERVRLAKDDPQGYGSALTYLRRYGLAAMVGIATEDDDANAASKPKARTSAPRAETPRTPPAAQQTASPPPAPMVPYLDQTPTTAAKGAWPWLEMQFKELGLDHAGAKRLLGIASIKEDMANQSFRQILAWTEKAKLEQLKAG